MVTCKRCARQFPTIGQLTKHRFAAHPRAARHTLKKAVEHRQSAHNGQRSDDIVVKRASKELTKPEILAYLHSKVAMLQEVIRDLEALP